MTGIGPAQLLIIAVIFVVLFGTKRLPDAARALGHSLRIFKAEVRELEKEQADPTTT